jgi:hypothetical protein
MSKAKPIAACRLAAISLAFAVCSSGATSRCAATELFVGNYSFSDELGGFRLISASGAGTATDPVVVEEEIIEVAPITLVIRNHKIGGGGLQAVESQLVLIKRVRNVSNRVWAAFEMELQEIPKKPSTYGDGLSFKQFAALPPDVSSDSFADNDRQFEPSDSIQFVNGHVDPGALAEFKVTITDPTPIGEFYLVQDPKLLAAELPMPSRSFAAVRN